MYVAGWGSAGYRLQAGFPSRRPGWPWGMEGELDGGDEAADG
jgi:hypothetical protein